MGARNRQTVRFEGVGKKPVDVIFDKPQQSSDGGLILLKAVDEKMRLTQRMAAALPDRRQTSKVEHAVPELLRERVFGLACGYEDCNDANLLADDPMIKLACDRSPARGEALASQPTLSRFENSLRRRDVYRMARALAEAVLEAQARRRLARPPRLLTFDLDATADEVHGGQQQAFFNSYYDCWVFLPLVTTVQFDDEPEGYQVAPLLRRGNAGGALGAIAILKRLFLLARRFFPHAKIRVRMDSAFAAPEVLEFLDDEGVLYLVSFAKNPVLERKARPLQWKVWGHAERTGEVSCVFGEAPYRAKRWKTSRRVIIKAEILAPEGKDPKDNLRFVVTNLEGAPEKVYQAYAARGNMENRVKELKGSLALGRTSCRSFLANQLRNLLTAAAYALFQYMRGRSKHPDLRKAQVQTLRERLVKVGVTVVESARRVAIHAPKAFVWFPAWRRMALACGALSG